jgi:glycerol-3-phosphate acyltransferase PlsY
MTIGVFVLALGAYVASSFNMAALVARSRSVDIYVAGSGNPGASNVYRTMGKGAAAVVYVSDLLKGFVPTLIALIVWRPSVAAFVGLTAVVGHCYPAFHKFRGGKGVATAGGVILAIAPLVLVGVTVLYTVIVRVTKISSVGSLIALLATVPLTALAGVGGWALGWLSLMIVLIIALHRSNISRLVGGSEHKVVTDEG